MTCHFSTSLLNMADRIQKSPHSSFIPLEALTSLVSKASPLYISFGTEVPLFIFAVTDELFKYENSRLVTGIICSVSVLRPKSPC